MIRRAVYFLNPITHLGERDYSITFPIIFALLSSILSEFFAYTIAHDPNIVGVYIIFINIAAIIYFAFRNGIPGGVISASLPILYYAYIIHTRQYQGTQLTSAIETTIMLAILYLLLGSIIGWLKQTIDNLIEQEANEKRRLQAIVEQLPVGIIVTDHKGKITQVNKKLEQILGTKIPLGFILGKDTNPLPSIHKGKPALATQSPLYQSLMTNKPIVNKEFALTRPDGRTITVQVSAAPINNRNGDVMAGASIITDVTVQKEIEERKDDFVNMASHELKTPLTSLKLYVDTLSHRIKSSDEQTARIIKSVKNQTLKLQELVSDLLDVSQIQTGKLNLKKDIFKLNDLVAETIAEIQSTTTNHTIIFEPKKSINLKADRFRIYQVMINLLTNAVKYSPDGGQIIVKTIPGKDNVTISVTDQGIGIDGNQQKKVFNRLYQVTDPKEKTYPGLGMGLYISQQIIKRHNGKIWIESEKGKGSTFFFELPLTLN